MFIYSVYTTSKWQCLHTSYGIIVYLSGISEDLRIKYGIGRNRTRSRPEAEALLSFNAFYSGGTWSCISSIVDS